MRQDLSDLWEKKSVIQVVVGFVWAEEDHYRYISYRKAKDYPIIMRTCSKKTINTLHDQQKFFDHFSLYNAKYF